MTLKEIFYDWGGLNTALFYAINSIHAGWYDQFMIVGTMLGKYKLFPIYLLLVIGFAWFDLSHKKHSFSPGYTFYRQRWFKTIAVLITGFAVELMWVQFLKDYFHFPRPFVALPEGSVVKLWDETPYSSFPSGHCSFAMLMIAGLWSSLSRQGKIAAVFYMVWVGLSRIVLGVHFPVDVLGSCFLSFLSTYLVRKVIYKIWPVKTA